MSEETEKPKQQLSPGVKLVTDLGPLVLFFVANARFDLFVATGVLMIAVLAALLYTWMRTRHVPVMPIVTAVLVLVFGGLTLYLHNETFIKMKPTIVYLLFAATLSGGLVVGKPLLRTVLETALPKLHPKGWTVLSLYWSGLFVGLAIANEIVWRTVSTDSWVTFKVFGLTALTFIFAIGQMPLIRKYQDGGPD